ncbi:MAG: GreA/GreB family elongation factor [Chthoniobacter sp.]|uniref:GreA/GreB family elongation factor n=1 Tax=Chthoniobacter sp. TaxID=2510640 RepID=UPI0032A5B42F
MDKRAVIQRVVDQIGKDLHALITAAKATHAEATHEQNKPENKYDTRALEASYLAQGQSRQVAELERARQEFESLSTVAARPDSPIDIGALLKLKQAKTETVYLLGPRAGGMEIHFEGTEITVITPHSPIGRELMGKVQGDSIVLPNNPGQKPVKITQVW